MTESFDDGPDQRDLPHSLPLPVPPNLAEAFGYKGDTRFVAFSHEPVGDETYFDDGHRSGTGNRHAFKLYREHAAVAPHLESFDLGGSDKPSTDALIIDRKEDQAAVLVWVEARQLLRCQHQELRKSHDTVIQREEVPRAVREVLKTPRSPTAEEVLRILQEKHRRETDLQRWLDQHAPPGEETAD